MYVLYFLQNVHNLVTLAGRRVKRELAELADNEVISETGASKSSKDTGGVSESRRSVGGPSLAKLGAVPSRDGESSESEQVLAA